MYIYRVPSLCEIEVFDARRVRVELGQHLALEACILYARETNLLCRNVKRFHGGLVSKAYRVVCHSTLGWRVIKKKNMSARETKSVNRGLPHVRNHGWLNSSSVQDVICPAILVSPRLRKWRTRYLRHKFKVSNSVNRVRL